MIKKFLPIAMVAVVFTAVFVRLHQKVQIYVEAYSLSKNYHIYNNLADKRDYLSYSFDKKISVARLSQWAEDNKFSLVGKDKILALNLRRIEPAPAGNGFSIALNRLLGISTASATAITEEKK